MRVVISSIGSRGDVQPILALAVELAALGHGATLCVAPNFKGWVESFGIECVPLGPDLRELVRRGAGARRNRAARARLRNSVPESVAEQFAVLAEATQGCDLVVAAGALQTAARSIAESVEIPYVYATYCPCTLPSPRHPPPMVRTQSLPTFVNRLLWCSAEWGSNRIFREPVNRQRAKLGLSPVTSVSRHVTTERPWLAADAILAPANANGGIEVTQTGAWFLDDSAELPDDLERFLDDGEPPIYFGFGSMGSPVAATELLVEAARSVGRRIIVSRGWAELALQDDGIDAFSIGDVNHAKLFPRIAAIVHHGGAGTTTAAARAGTPQVVIPHIYDQHYWAHRVELLGIGAASPAASRPSAHTLARSLRECLQTDTVAAAQRIAGRMELHGARIAAEKLVAEFD
jgi:vancomycin aglycone glucosyltransferase